MRTPRWHKVQHESTVAMPAALCGTRRVTAKQIDTESADWPRPLRCPYCPAQVGPVVSHTGETRKRAAHFRLYRGHRHGPGCEYDIPARMGELIPASAGTLRRDGDGYRLVLPEVAAQPTPRLPAPRGHDEEILLARRRTALLNTAARVAGVIERYRLDGADIAEHFRASCRGVTVPWPAFFYLPRVAWRLRNRLGEAELTHPVAVALHVERAGASRDGSSYFVSQTAPPDWRDPGPGPKPPPLHIALRTREPRLLEKHEPGTWLLALGMWKAWTATSGTRTEIQLWITEPGQVAVIPTPPSMTVLSHTR